MPCCEIIASFARIRRGRLQAKHGCSTKQTSRPCNYSVITPASKIFLAASFRLLLCDHFDTIDYFTKKISNITEKMQADVIDDPVVKQLLQQAGIGMITAITMRALKRRVQSAEFRVCSWTLCTLSSDLCTLPGRLPPGRARLCFAE